MRKIRSSSYWIEQTAHILNTVWRRHAVRHGECYVIVAAVERSTDILIEEAFKLDEAERKLHWFLKKHPRARWDLYWSPNPYRNPWRSNRLALSTSMGWGIFDKVRVIDLRPQANLVWGAHDHIEALWFWDRKMSPGRAEAASRRLAQQPGADRNGWLYNKLLRMPHTYWTEHNIRRPMEVLHYDTGLRRPPTVKSRKAAKRTVSADPSKQGRYVVTEDFRDQLSPGLFCIMRHGQPKLKGHRRALNRIVDGLAGLGANVDQMASVVWRSPYFLQLYGPDRNRLNHEIGRGLARAGRRPNNSR
jgi:hypothetical protein